jgi:hypothetical protein
MINAVRNRFVILPSDSYVEVESRTSLHTILGRGTDLSGFIDAAWSDGELLLDPPPALRIEVPIEKLKSANAAQDAEMKKFLGSRAFPAIAVELRKAERLPEKDQFKVRGAITVRGSTAEYEGRITVIRNRNRLTIDGSEMIYIRKLGLEPPKILIFQVAAYVRVTLHLVAALPQ